MVAWELEVGGELVDEKPEFWFVHGGVMSVGGSILGSMGLDPVDVGSREFSVGGLAPSFNGSIKLAWSESMIVVGVNLMEDVISNFVRDAILGFWAFKMEVLSKLVDEDEKLW